MSSTNFASMYRDGAVLDEIQRAPELLSYLQGEVDERPESGRFILTGLQHFGLSATISESLAGRCAVLSLLPPSLLELRRFPKARDDLYSSAQELNLSALGGDAGVCHNTARSWLSVPETSFVLHRLPAWHANLRKQIVKAPKLHLFDSGLLCHLLGIREDGDLVTDRLVVGLRFDEILFGLQDSQLGLHR